MPDATRLSSGASSRTWLASSDASHATIGELSDGSSASNSSHSSGSFAATKPGTVCVMRVAPPGAMQFTVTPMRARSRLQVRVSPTMPAFAAV